MKEMKIFVAIVCVKCGHKQTKELSRLDLSTYMDAYYGKTEIEYDFSCKNCGLFKEISIE